MLENSIYSVISPEGCASILWKDVSKSEEAANALKLTSRDLNELGVIDEVIPEPMGGAHRDHQQIFSDVKKSILENINAVAALDPNERVRLRNEKYSRMGSFEEMNHG